MAREAETHKNTLSSREQTLLELIAGGTSTREMAAQLFMSEATVKRGVRQLLDQLNAHTRAEAVAEAHRRGLL